ncbi:NPP1 protein [Phytophthora cinnamomi]|uniref:NPP1 protein n=1 Tax=Phytophthora cinnamomi TaxID=4785 RepID=UPI00355A368A|nr:NPP1 protein [Phytophthora cinnamomi]
MADLQSNDQVLIDDIVGLLDFDAPLTPKVPTIGSLGDASNKSSPFVPQVVDTVSPSSASSDDNAQANKRSTKREKEKVRQRRHRQRLKDSRDELQCQVNELSRHLEALVQEAERKRQKMEATSNQRTSSGWMEADFQRTQRLKSEARQLQLVSAMTYQAEYIKSLRRMYSKANASRADRFPLEPCIPTFHSMTSVLYTTYLQQLEGCYARVDMVMDACGVVSLPETTLSTIHRRNSDGDVAYFQHVNKAMLPCSFQQTCDVLWRAVQEQEEPAFGGIEVAPDSDVFIKSRVLRAAGIGTLAQRYVSRRYFEETRMVLVWKMSSEGDAGFRGLHAEETGWLCVEPSPGGVVLSACVQQVPMRFCDPKCLQPAIAPFYNLLNESLEADKMGMTTSMGRMLLDDVRTVIEC